VPRRPNSVALVSNLRFAPVADAGSGDNNGGGHRSLCGLGDGPALVGGRQVARQSARREATTAVEGLYG
jgi:hypothetical protein